MNLYATFIEICLNMSLYFCLCFYFFLSRNFLPVHCTNFVVVLLLIRILFGSQFWVLGITQFFFASGLAAALRSKGKNRLILRFCRLLSQTSFIESKKLFILFSI